MQTSLEEPPLRRPEELDEVVEADAADDPETAAEGRGLHAKVVAVWVGRRADVIIGSANLTGPGWLGANAEAWLRLSGDPTLADALWDWSFSRSTEYRVPVTPPVAAKEATDVLDDVHRYVAGLRYTLHEHGRDDGLLEASASPLTVAGLRLRVARLSMPTVTSLWPDVGLAVPIAGCDASERTAFMIFTLSSGEGGSALTRGWVQRITLEPALERERDGALLRRVLGPTQFLEYLRGYLELGASDGPDPALGAQENLASNSDGGGSDRSQELRVETILRALAKSPKETVVGLGAAIKQYQSVATLADNPQLRGLWQVWRAIEAVYGE
jgi:hypothetical protein